MVLATHDEGTSRGFLQHRERTVATNIMECADDLVLAFDEDEGESGNVEGAVTPWFVKVGGMCRIQPGLN